MITSWFKFRRRIPKISLVIFGTEFGSYQFLQLVQASRKYEVAGFVSSDPWQQRSGFGKIGVIQPDQLGDYCRERSIAAIVVTSDQRESFEKDDEMAPVRSMSSLVRHTDVLAIPQTADAEMADNYLSELLINFRQPE